LSRDLPSWKQESESLVAQARSALNRRKQLFPARAVVPTEFSAAALRMIALPKAAARPIVRRVNDSDPLVEVGWGSVALPLDTTAHLLIP
jgi:hypothetical protein